MENQEEPSQETKEKWNQDPNNWTGDFFITTKRTNA